jgi:hypothetical protein
VYAYGEGFTQTSMCLVNNASVIASTFISSSLLACTVGSNPPGVLTFGITRSGASGTISALTVLSVSAQAKSDSLSGSFNPVSPSSGQITGGTTITVTGRNFDLVGKSLYCFIGDEMLPAFAVTATSLSCTTPPSLFVGLANVGIGTSDGEILDGGGVFEYAENPRFNALSPEVAAAGTELQVLGSGFARWPDITCFVAGVEAITTVLSDSKLICRVPALGEGSATVSLRTNGQNFAVSSGRVTIRLPTSLYSVWPTCGPAIRGGTIVTVKGSGFPNTVDIQCVFGVVAVPAAVVSGDALMCRAPTHEQGLLNLTILSDGINLCATSLTSTGMTVPIISQMQFLYLPDPAVIKITPSSGSNLGGYSVFVRASNIVNSTVLGCKFGNLISRAVFISINTLLCVAPSLSPADALNYSFVPLEITTNGLDYTDDQVQFTFLELSAEGFYRPNVVELHAPNGTYCPADSRNFTLCSPGTFQPQEKQPECIPCPVSFICPDFGMSRPRICPAGFICDVLGLTYPRLLCPMGHYCLEGTTLQLSGSLFAVISHV